MLNSKERGQVITANGLVSPELLGRVMMHEHLHCGFVAEDGALVTKETPVPATRRQYLLDHAAPLLRRCREEFGMKAYVDVTMPPWRGWPDLYRDVSRASGVHILIATGFYREMEVGTYFVKRPEDAIWNVVRDSPVEALAALCIREIVEGIHGTGIRAGAIKLGSSQTPLTALEMKTFIAGARAQRETGVHITTHCTQMGGESSQLTLLDREGVDLSRVVIGHTAGALMDPAYRKTMIEWMKRGASFLPTNICVQREEDWKPQWQLLVDAIHAAFDAGCGDKLFLSLDGGYCSVTGPFGPVTYIPPDPWRYLFTDVLPAFRHMGLTAQEEEAIMVANPAKILPVR
ncbi:MAG: hypothetical protein HY343_00250 [Lentisphaerae bacterium]|nr:hypothetical protein [Lentisphaerota bacterium]